jgi:hypothetical protein
MHSIELEIEFEGSLPRSMATVSFPIDLTVQKVNTTIQKLVSLCVRDEVVDEFPTEPLHTPSNCPAAGGQELRCAPDISSRNC